MIDERKYKNTSIGWSAIEDTSKEDIYMEMIKYYGIKLCNVEEILEE